MLLVKQVLFAVVLTVLEAISIGRITSSSTTNSVLPTQLTARCHGLAKPAASPTRPSELSSHFPRRSSFYLRHQRALGTSGPPLVSHGTFGRCAAGRADLPRQTPSPGLLGPCMRRHRSMAPLCTLTARARPNSSASAWGSRRCALAARGLELPFFRTR